MEVVIERHHGGKYVEVAIVDTSMRLTTGLLNTNDANVLAEKLRAAANEIDPPQKNIKE